MPEDFRQFITNVEPSPDQSEDWRAKVAFDAGILAAPPPPPAIDLREVWWTIGHQGATGSCVGWACADALLRWHFVKAGRLAPTERLSVRQVWMASKEMDEFSRPSTFIEVAGTSLKSALDAAKKYGVVPDAMLPFDSAIFYTGDEDAFFAVAAQRRVASYFNLGTSATKWRQWLASSGPILTRLDCDDAWYDAAQTAGHLTTYVRPSRPAGHAVAIVGYTSDHFIVRNSWGTAWGDGGFAYASNDYARKAFTEAYGVVV